MANKPKFRRHNHFDISGVPGDDVVGNSRPMIDIRLSGFSKKILGLTIGNRSAKIVFSSDEDPRIKELTFRKLHIIEFPEGGRFTTATRLQRRVVGSPNQFNIEGYSWEDVNKPGPDESYRHPKMEAEAFDHIKNVLRDLGPKLFEGLSEPDAGYLKRELLSIGIDLRVMTTSSFDMTM